MIRKEGNSYRSTLVKQNGYEYVLGWKQLPYKHNIIESINVIRFVLNSKTRDRLKIKNKNVKS